MNAIELIQSAMQRAEAIKPKVGGFPYLAECLRQAGATKNLWYLPSGQCLFFTENETVAIQGQPLVSGFVIVPHYDEIALIAAIRRDQVGESTFPEFLEATWQAGVIEYEVDFDSCTVAYKGALGEQYVEEYPKVDILD